MLTETIISMQGDDADDALSILYAAGGPTAESIAATVAHLAQWDYGDPTEVHEVTPDLYNSVRSGDYLMQWHYGLTWISLDRVLSD